ncbi:putative LEM3/CDC50 family protein [Plasmodium gaboni]|uniref:LEM3/CDC50 family protein, putative n=1 Tax=Plasmodium gaboni TaxID=647221 RepID=A0A151LJD2_9APIC|nr:putative LEM3/CDC50 family protein [Plasmodium gaboni]KYN98969.1 putative LEM3/CDC50 family protein [Plasmodium gaboni]SOV15860.1 LEM3/CDC50 family protein, putative [Plasmodium gaboni]SOV23409.1 LEM3/CDC50 family protein, putative [Plasmodium sp. DRC-Itaito]
MSKLKNDMFLYKKKRKFYYKKSSRFVRFLYSFVKWYKMERVVGPVWINKYSSIIYFLMFLFILNLSVGILILILSSQYIECRIPYEYKGETYTKYSIIKVTPEQCKGQKNLKELNGNINVHYEILGIEQNHYKFVSGMKKEQLNGNIFLNKEELEECYPLITFSEGKKKKKLLHPCGIFPWNIFTDSYIFYDKEPDEVPFPTPLPLKQNVEDITIKYYRQFFKNPTPQNIQLYKDHIYFWMDPDIQYERLQENKETNEKLLVLPQTLKYNQAGKAIENSHFINWMIPSALNYIKRLYGKLYIPLKFPFYIYIENNFKINDTKIIVLSTSQYYIRTFLIGFIFIIISIIALILCIFYLIRMNKHENK